LFPLRVASGYLSKLGDVGWIKNLLSPITMLIEKVKIFIGNFQYARSLGANFAQSFLSAGNAVGGIFSKIGKLLAGIAVPIDFVISKFNIFKTFVSSIFNALKTLVSSIFSPITDAIKPIIGAFKSVGEGSKFLKPLLGFLKIGKVGLTAVPILGEIIMAIEFIYNAWKRISVIFNDPNLNIGQKIFASVVGLYGALYDTLIQPFIDIGEWIIKAVWGEDILKGIKAVVNDIYTILKSPFEKAYNWIMDLLGGKSPSKIGLAIVDGIESVVDMLFDVLTYPFKKAAQIIPEIINILKTTFVDAFKSAMDAMSEVGDFIKDTFSGAFTFIIGALEKVWEKMKGIGSFISDTIGKTFSFVGRIVGTSEETPSKTATESKTSVKTDDLLINTIVNSNRVLAEKLDKLTSMMASGQIAVYIDGQRANQLLATSNSKFGSFGQATTN
jgi:phage-related protein